MIDWNGFFFLSFSPRMRRLWRRVRVSGDDGGGERTRRPSLVFPYVAECVFIPGMEERFFANATYDESDDVYEYSNFMWERVSL